MPQWPNFSIAGGAGLKVDLHVHTPASSDIAEKWLLPRLVRILYKRELMSSGLRQCRLVHSAHAHHFEFPVELYTPRPHIGFDTMVPSAQIEDLLVRVAPGDFGSLHVATAGGIQEVSAEIAKAGGAIAAHADGRGFLKTIQVGAERERAYLASALRAIELLDSTARDEHQSGKRYPRSMTIQSSDSWPEGADHHDLDGIAIATPS